jgi:hypothetical protein
VGDFRHAIAIAGLNGPGREAFDRLLVLHEAAMSLVERASDLYDQGEYAKAFDLAEETKTTYANLLHAIYAARRYPDPARLAAALLTRIKKDPDARPALRERTAARSYAKVRELWSNAEDAPALYLDVCKGLKAISRRFPDTPTGQKCVLDVEELLADTRTSTIIELEEQRRFIASALQSAEQYQLFGQFELAAAEEAKLTNRFPGKSLEDLREMAKKRL